MRDVKGSTYESDIRNKAAAIFGRLIRRGRDGNNDVIDHLYDTETITEDEIDQVLSADLIWTGKQRKGDQQIVLVVEVSWLAEANDVTRAYERANIVQKAGMLAIPVVAGKAWTTEALDLAEERQALIVVDTGITPQSLTTVSSR